MLITRRQAIIGAGAAALIRPSLSFAKGTPGGVMATNYNNSWYTNAGPIPGMPATASAAIFALAWRTSDPFSVGANVLQTYFVNNEPLDACQLGFQQNGGISTLYLSIGSNTNYTIGRVSLPNASNDTWQHAVIAMDTVKQWAVCCYNGVSVLVSLMTSGAGPYQATPQVGWSLAGIGLIGRTVQYPYNGDLAEVVGYLGNSVPDPTQPNILADFWDSINNVPQRIATGGYLPNSSLQAQIHLAGPPSMALPNFAGYPFYGWGAEESPFNLAGGSAATMSSVDPWGSTAET